MWGPASAELLCDEDAGGPAVGGQAGLAEMVRRPEGVWAALIG